VTDDKIKTYTVWKLVHADIIDTDPTCDVIALGMQANGKEYAVVVSGPKGMTTSEFIPALRAAAMGLTAIVQGETGKVSDDAAMNDATFDTGNQRPS
jgi:hypothetical protein